MIDEKILNEMYFSDKCLAERYKVSRSTIWRWLESGNLPQPVKFSSGATRWRLSTIAEFESKLDEVKPA